MRVVKKNILVFSEISVYLFKIIRNSYLQCKLKLFFTIYELVYLTSIILFLVFNDLRCGKAYLFPWKFLYYFVGIFNIQRFNYFNYKYYSCLQNQQFIQYESTPFFCYKYFIWNRRWYIFLFYFNFCVFGLIEGVIWVSYIDQDTR